MFYNVFIIHFNVAFCVAKDEYFVFLAFMYTLPNLLNYEFINIVIELYLKSSIFTENVKMYKMNFIYG